MRKRIRPGWAAATLAVAWCSPTIPPVAVALFFAGMPYGPGNPLSMQAITLALLACVAGFVAGLVGVVLGTTQLARTPRRVGVMAIVGGVLGMVLNVVGGLFPCLGIALSGIKG